MSKLFKLLSVCVLSVSVMSVAQANTMRLRDCMTASTPQGLMFVGTYCTNLNCSQTVKLVFDKYCPINPATQSSSDDLNRMTIELGGNAGALMGRGLGGLSSSN